MSTIIFNLRLIRVFSCYLFRAWIPCFRKNRFKMGTLHVSAITSSMVRKLIYSFSVLVLVLLLYVSYSTLLWNTSYVQFNIIMELAPYEYLSLWFAQCNYIIWMMQRANEIQNIDSYDELIAFLWVLITNVNTNAKAVCLTLLLKCGVRTREIKTDATHQRQKRPTTNEQTTPIPQWATTSSVIMGIWDIMT